MLLSSRMAQLTKARPAQAIMVQPAARDSDSDSVVARPVNREQLGLRLRLRLARTGGGCRDPSFRYESHNLSLNSVVPLAGTGPGLLSGICATAAPELRPKCDKTARRRGKPDARAMRVPSSPQGRAAAALRQSVP